MENTSETVTLLVGPGTRLVELRAVLGALASLPGSTVHAEPRAVDDLADLMEPRVGSGRLLLESEHVPVEDIGFVRRFLERNPDWQLVLVGTDRDTRKAQRLLSFAGAGWLHWPPDLDQVKGLLAGGRELDSPARAAAPEDELADELVPRPGPADAGARPAEREPEPAAAAATGCDLGVLLEEILAGRSVGGEDAPRYLYRAEAELEVALDAAALNRVFEGLFAMAESCAGAGQVIGVRAQAADEDAQVVIDFPPGPLTDGDLPGLFDGSFSGEPELERGIAAAKEAGEALSELGGSARLTTGRPGRLSLEATLPVRQPAAR